MKKFIALLLAALLLLSVGVSALAEYDANDNSTWTSEATTFTFTKTYVMDTTTKQKTNKFPAEELEFTITADAGNPKDKDGEVPMITIGSANKFTITDVENTITVNVPSYSVVGVYKYTITEKAGSSQGVTYDDTSINVAVLVSYDYDKKTLKVDAGVEKASADAEKNDKLYNQYDLGGDPGTPDKPEDYGKESLKVTKKVTGNLGDTSQYFLVAVTLTADKTVNSEIEIEGGSDSRNPEKIEKGWSGKNKVEIYLKHGETVAFNYIPAGVKYEVVEDDAHTDATEWNSGDSSKGYTATYKDETGTITKGEKPTAAITNEKKTEINTGITLDTLPYIVALAVVAIGVLAFILRRRRREDD